MARSIISGSLRPMTCTYSNITDWCVSKCAWQINFWWDMPWFPVPALSGGLHLRYLQNGPLFHQVKKKCTGCTNSWILILHSFTSWACEDILIFDCQPLYKLFDFKFCPFFSFQRPTLVRIRSSSVQIVEISCLSDFMFFVGSHGIHATWISFNLIWFELSAGMKRLFFPCNIIYNSNSTPWLSETPGADWRYLVGRFEQK